MLCIRLLGNLDVTYNGAALKLPVLPRTVPLWAYLLLHRGSAVPRTTLAYTLWPDQPETAARTNLARHVHQLRRALPTPPPNGDWLVATTSTLLWQIQPGCWLDVAEFERLAANPDTLAAAVELYRGDLLTNVYDDWLFYERERLRDLYLTSLEQLAQERRTQRDYPAAIAYAHQLLATDPLHESGARLLISVRYEAGERASALAEYERFAALLGRELDVAPMPETVAVYEAIVHNTNLPGANASTSLPATPVVASDKGVRSRFSLPFVGRQDELERLKLAWSRAANGHGGISIIAGEAGIGKSRLVAELAQLTEAQGARILRGNATLAEPIPYQAVVMALRSALPLLAALESDAPTLSAILPLLPELSTRRPDLHPLPRIDAERERDRLYQALTAILRRLAQPRPLLLILEDLHWAGAATIDLLEFLARQVQTQPILIIATYREEEARRSHPLRLLRRRLTQEGGLLQLDLGRLSAEQSASLVKQVPALTTANEAQVQQLYDESEGNPFFLGELILSQLEADNSPDSAVAAARAMPSGVQNTISERIARLPSNTRLIAEVAAVAGTAFNLELVREVAGWDEDKTLTALDELLDRGLVREAGRRSGYDYAFTHHLIQETIHNAIDQMVRKRRHRRLALVLEEIYPERQEELSLELATHFDQGDDTTRAAPYYQRAARRALAVYAMEEALAACSRAAELATDPRFQFDSLALRADINHQLGNREAEQADLAQMASISDDLGDEELICAMLQRKISFVSALGEREQQARLVGELAAHAEASGSVRWQAAALYARAYYHYQISKYDAVHSVLDQALPLYQQLADSAAQVECYCLLADSAANQGRVEEARGLLEQARSLSSPDNQALLLRIISVAANAAVLLGNNAMGHDLSLQALTISQALHDRNAEADAYNRLAAEAEQMMRYHDSLCYYEQAMELHAALGRSKGMAIALGNIGILYGRVGRYAEAIAAFQRSEALYRTVNNILGQVLNTINIADTANMYRDYRRAHRTALRGLALTRALDNPILEADLLCNLGVTELGRGKYDAAIERLEACLALRRAIAESTADELSDVLCYLAIAHLWAGRPSAAQQASAEALQFYEMDGEPEGNPESAIWVAACVAGAGGDAAHAATYLARAYAIVSQNQAAWIRELADFPSSQWQPAFLNYQFNGAIIAAYERDEWPAYATRASQDAEL